MIYAVFGDVLSLIQKGLFVVSPLFLYRNIYSSLIKWAYVIHIREVSIFVFIIDIYIYMDFRRYEGNIFISSNSLSTFYMFDLSFFEMYVLHRRIHLACVPRTTR